VRLGDLPAEREADARSRGFRREEGHEQVGGVRQAGAFIFDDQLEVVVHPLMINLAMDGDNRVREVVGVVGECDPPR
jgi:hypothetical protein